MIFSPFSLLSRLSAILICMAILMGVFSCKNNTGSLDGSNVSIESVFFGDSTLTLISTNHPNGYDVKLFKSKDLILLNLKRGDSINQYVQLYDIPMFFADYSIDSIGIQYCKFNIPVEKDSLVSGVFFMDVNFDNEDELVIQYPGYNRNYFACFDLVHGIPSPNILEPISEPPYNNIVSSDYGCKTDFDFKNKTIHIYEEIGCCSHIETWCKMMSDYEYDTPKLVVYKEEHVDYANDGSSQTTIYKRVDGELKKVDVKINK